jgi:hypothetical protein
MNNYEKAQYLLNEGIAKEHGTFKTTGYIVLDLGGAYTGYASPREEYVEVVKNNTHVGYGNIDLEKLVVLDTSNRYGYDRSIEKWEVTEVGCVAKRPFIK